MSDPHQARDYIGQGFSFPLGVTIQGSFPLSQDIKNIEESIALILGTKLGERIYRPDFGSRLSELVFAPLNSETLVRLRLYVQEALEMWESRIIIEGIYAEPDPVQGRINVLIAYRPKESYDSHSLIYPFYLMSPT